MTDKAERWIAAAKQFHIDRESKIICAECEKGFLNLKIEPFGAKGEDWYLICNHCGKYNVATKFDTNDHI